MKWSQHASGLSLFGQTKEVLEKLVNTPFASKRVSRDGKLRLFLPPAAGKCFWAQQRGWSNKNYAII